MLLAHGAFCDRLLAAVLLDEFKCISDVSSKISEALPPGFSKRVQGSLSPGFVLNNSKSSSLGVVSKIFKNVEGPRTGFYRKKCPT